MQPCNLSPTQSQTHLQFACTRPHTRVTHRMFGVQNDLPRVLFSRPSPRQLTDTQHSSIPPRVTAASAVQGAFMCVFVLDCGVTKLVSGEILERVFEELSYRHILQIYSTAQQGLIRQRRTSTSNAADTH